MDLEGTQSDSKPALLASGSSTTWRRSWEQVPKGCEGEHIRSLPLSCGPFSSAYPCQLSSPEKDT
jgi:hypothetical protein